MVFLGGCWVRGQARSHAASNGERTERLFPGSGTWRSCGIGEVEVLFFL